MKILQESTEPLPSRTIQQLLDEQGMELSERTIRFHLQALDRLGFTRYREKKGRIITPKGILELSRTHIYEHVGFLSARIDEMMYQVRFDLASREGTVLVNLTLINKKDHHLIKQLVTPVFRSGLTYGDLLALYDEGERAGDRVIPEGMIGLATVCSINFNAALIKVGVPVKSIFGGLLEMENAVPKRFTAIIKYDGTSLDPLEIFISGKTTSTRRASAGELGQIGVSFREIPAIAHDAVIEVDRISKEAGFGGFLKIGYPNNSLLDIPVSEGRMGIVLSGGLNAVAPLAEAGLEIKSRALAGLIDFRSLFHYKHIDERLAKLSR